MFLSLSLRLCLSVHHADEQNNKEKQRFSTTWKITYILNPIRMIHLPLYPSA